MSEIFLSERKMNKKYESKKNLNLRNNTKSNKEEYISTDSSPKKENRQKRQTVSIINISEENLEKRNKNISEEDDYKTINDIFSKYKQIRKNKFNVKKKKNLSLIKDLKRKTQDEIFKNIPSNCKEFIINKNNQYQEIETENNFLQKKRKKDDNKKDNEIKEKYMKLKEKEENKDKDSKDKKDNKNLINYQNIKRNFEKTNDIFEFLELEKKKERNKEKEFEKLKDKFTEKIIDKSKGKNEDKFINEKDKMKTKQKERKKEEEIVINDDNIEENNMKTDRIVDENKKVRTKDFFTEKDNSKKVKEKKIGIDKNILLIKQELKNIINEAQKRKEIYKGKESKSSNKSINNINEYQIEKTNENKNDKKNINNIKNDKHKNNSPIPVINLNNIEGGLRTNFIIGKKEDSETQNKNNVNNKPESIIKIEEDSDIKKETNDLDKIINTLNKNNKDNMEIYTQLNSLIQNYGSLKVILILLFKFNLNENIFKKNNMDLNCNIFNLENYMKNNEFKNTFDKFKNRLNDALFSDYNCMFNSKKCNGMDLNLNLIKNSYDSNIPVYFRDKMHSIERHKGNLKKCMECNDEKKDNKIDYFCNICKIPLHPECFMKYHNSHVYNLNSRFNGK